MSDVTSFEVTGDWRHIIDDGMVDGDDLPDEVPLTGKVEFKPVFPSVAIAGTPATAYTVGAVTALVAGGVLTDLQGRPGVKLVGKIGEHSVRWTATTTLRFHEQKVPYPSVDFELTEDARLTGIIRQSGPALKPVVLDPRIEAIAAMMGDLDEVAQAVAGYAGNAADQVVLAEQQADRAVGLAAAQDTAIAGRVTDPASATHAAFKAVGNATYGQQAWADPESDVRQVADAIYAQEGDIPTGVVKAVNGVSPDLTGAVSIPEYTGPEFVFSTDPDAPVPEGGVLLVYEPPVSAVETFATGLGAWSPKWAATTSWAGADDATATDGKVAKATGTTARRALAWNALSAPDSRNIEILAKVKAVGGGGSFLSGVVARGSGAATQESGYIASMYQNACTIGRWNNGAITVLGSGSAVHTTYAVWYWLRFRVIGSNLSARLWRDGTTEPAFWEVEVTDTTHASDGFAGLFTSLGVTQQWDTVAVALDGARAVVA